MEKTCEGERLTALQRYRILDTPTEPYFDEITALLAGLFKTDAAAIGFVDDRRVWLKSKVGLPVSEVPRTIAICDRVIQGRELLILQDTALDAELSSNPLVTDGPKIRFYAGTPLLTPEGFAIGSLCIADPRPRRMLEEDLSALPLLARHVMTELERRREAAERANIRSLLQAIVDACPVAIVARDREGLVQVWNPAARTLFDWTAEEVLGRPSPLSSQFPGDGSSAMLRLVIRGQTVTALEMEKARKDGRRIQVSASSAPVRDLMGEITGEVGIFQDIAERLRRERLEKCLVRLLPRLTEAETELQVGRAVAGQCRQLFGQDAFALWTPSSAFVYVQDTRPGSVEPEEVPADGFRIVEEASMLGPGLESRVPPGPGFPYRARASAGSSRMVAPVLRNGQVLACLIVERYEPDMFKENDLDSLKVLAQHSAGALARVRVQRALARSHERFVELVDSLDGIVWEMDPSTVRFIFVSKSAERLLGYPTSMWTGDPSFLSTRIHPEDRDRVLKGFQSRSERTSLEFRMISAGGDVVWMRSFARAGPGGGDRSSLRGVLVDITELKGAEEAVRRTEEKLHQMEKLEALGRLAGGVAHDFNNALTAVIGFSELSLVDLGPEHPSAENLRQIRQAGKHAASLTRQLLAYGRRQMTSPQDLDLNAVIRSVLPMLRSLLREDIDLVFRSGNDIGGTLADPTQVEEVILNLVINARDAMTNGGRVEIETGLAEAEEAGGGLAIPPKGKFVRVSVSDTGVGMDEEVRAHLFEPFFTTKGVGKGTGLGLCSVYGIAKQSAGYVWVDSALGKGTRVRVYLPHVRDACAGASATPRLSPEPRASGTILVVEDRDCVRLLASRMLESVGYRPLLAANPDEAIRVSATHDGPIDLLLTDVVMPGLPVGEMVRTILERHPAARVVHMSGYASETVAHHGVGRDRAAFVAKPFSYEQLLQTVREVLAAK